ncbi:T9SS type A sorting domain-containing protein [Flavobacterium sp. SM2513]|uniref:T9SS type A sorting domain-containing protein n=1 Tax=Flavobacterium sp. SM2513 TaxID=3424766 RepID=UPI003D7FE497
MQNNPGTSAITPQERNTGNWSASQEAWRFLPNGTETTPLVTLQWFDQNSNIIGTGDSIEVCPTTNQQYSVSATYTRCGGTDVIMVQDSYAVQIENLAVHDANQANTAFQMYPNPVDNLLHIKSNTALESVEIYSLQGQRVLTTIQNQINVSQLASGVYLIRILDVNKASVTRKLVKN